MQCAVLASPLPHGCLREGDQGLQGQAAAAGPSQRERGGGSQWLITFLYSQEFRHWEEQSLGEKTVRCSMSCLQVESA